MPPELYIFFIAWKSLETLCPNPPPKFLRGRRTPTVPRMMKRTASKVMRRETSAHKIEMMTSKPEEGLDDDAMMIQTSKIDMMRRYFSRSHQEPVTATSYCEIDMITGDQIDMITGDEIEMMMKRTGSKVMSKIEEGLHDAMMIQTSKFLQPQTQALIAILQKNPSKFQSILPPTLHPSQGEIEAETLVVDPATATDTEEIKTLIDPALKASLESNRLRREFISFKYSVKQTIKDKDLLHLLDAYVSRHHGPLMFTSNFDVNGIKEELNNYLSKRNNQHLLLQNSLEKTTAQLLAETEDFLRLKEKITSKRETGWSINICAYPVAFSAAVVALLYAFKRLHSSH